MAVSDPGSDFPNQIISGGSPSSTYEENGGGYTPSSRTVSDVIRAVRRQFGDDAGVQVTDQNIIDWINDGQDTIVNRNRILKSRSYTESIAGIAQYQFPEANIEQVETVHYDGKPLRSISFAQAEQHARLWTDNVPSQPIVWWEWAGSFSLWPTPVDAREIALFYTTRPLLLSTITDYLQVPDKYFQTLVQYVMQQAYELDEDWQAAQQKEQQFETNINQFGEEERTGERLTYETITDVDESEAHYYGPGWI
jgi:hypothetical protein